MQTDQLIRELVTSQRPTGRPQLRIAAAIGAAWLVALAGMYIILGPPLQHLGYTGIAAFAVKLGYTVAVACLAAMAAVAAGRPGSSLSGRAGLLAIPFAILLLVVWLELGSVEPAARKGMLIGSDYSACVTSVVLASLPVFAGLVWAYRVLAPTRLPAAGFLIGLSSGAAGAVAFALYCHEATTAFLLAAYTPAMMIPAMIGAIVARPLLKW